VAAAVIGVLLLGVPTLGTLLVRGQSDSASPSSAGADAVSTARDGGNQAAVPEMGSAAGGAIVTFSGADYSPAILKTMARVGAVGAPTLPDTDAAKSSLAPTAAPQVLQSEEGALGAPDLRQAPSELDRLLDPAALRTCLDAVTAATPGRVTAVDYARYEGRPALIVIVGRLSTDAGGATRSSGLTVVVVGPACGATGMDRYALSGQG
jgi:hypothetical protein